MASIEYAGVVHLRRKYLPTLPVSGVVTGEHFGVLDVLVKRPLSSLSSLSSLSCCPSRTGHPSALSTPGRSITASRRVVISCVSPCPLYSPPRRIRENSSTDAPAHPPNRNRRLPSRPTRSPGAMGRAARRRGGMQPCRRDRPGETGPTVTAAFRLARGMGVSLSAVTADAEREWRKRST